MAEIIFYSNGQSRGQIAHWMLEELGEPYETRWLGYGESMKSPEYLAINPMGKVPAIQHAHAGGTAVVTETAAICAYLAAAYPAKGLMPAPGDPGLADYYRWLFFAAGPLEMAITVRAMQWEAPPEREANLGFGSHKATLNAVEQFLTGREHVCACGFTAADVYLASHLSWGQRMGTIEPSPAIAAYAKHQTQRPAYQRAEQLCAEAAKRQG